MQKIVVLAGPTAIGKTELSLTIAEEFGCEIVSMDSMQLYKYMDIGTAKPTTEEQKRVAHHLVDFVDPADSYNVARYVTDAQEAIRLVRSRNHLPMLVGGTGLYMKGLLEGLFEMPQVPAEIREKVSSMLAEKGSDYLHRELEKIDQESAARIHPHDSQRLTRAFEIFQSTGVAWSTLLKKQQEERQQRKRLFAALKIGLNCEREVLYERINRRVGVMVDQGLLFEVENLLARGYGPELNAMQSIGYKHMVNFINKVWTWQEALEYLARDTRRYAKRQLTWFKRDPEITWFRPDDIAGVRSFLQHGL